MRNDGLFVQYQATTTPPTPRVVSDRSYSSEPLTQRSTRASINRKDCESEADSD